MATVEVKLLGGFAVVADGQRIEGPWRLRKAKTLSSCLRSHLSIAFIVMS